jgi:hypothetical protein
VFAIARDQMIELNPDQKQAAIRHMNLALRAYRARTLRETVAIMDGVNLDDCQVYGQLWDAVGKEMTSSAKGKFVSAYDVTREVRRRLVVEV